MTNHHFLVISLHGQGHLNPTLQFAKRLVRAGARVTFATTIHGLKTIKQPVSIDGLSYAAFSDGYDDGRQGRQDWFDKLKSAGGQTLRELITRSSNNENDFPITCLIYTLLLPWAADLASELGLCSAFLCIQSATTFAIYDRCFNNKYGSCDRINNKPPDSIQITGLPLLACDDMPTFLLPSSPHSAIIPVFREHIETLERNFNSCVLLNTFHALEEDSIKAVSSMKVFTIGPLIPSAFLDGNDPEDKAFGCDLFDRSKEKDYLQWLNSKPNSSVVYVSFGSLVVVKKEQTDELFAGLMASSRPFLMVIRTSDDQGREDLNALIKKHNFSDEDQGLVIPWCCQVEVLNHPSVGCFISHLGWNSTLESLVAGVPVVGYPQLSDQVTNAKMIDEVWKKGVRAKVNQEGVVVGEEIKRCVGIVLGDGERGVEIRANALKWKEMAIDAVKEDGPSDINLKLFMEWLRENKNL